MPSTHLEDNNRWALSNDGSHYVFTLPLEKSENDDREYRLVRLHNCLEALLVHDPNTDKASAALDVNVGNMSDPEDLQGLAHFCEHLLFMGTEKYPKENEYSQYLSKHSGQANAFTSYVNTNYHFEVAHDYLEGALDRFAQFFVRPLFNESCTERELKAVDSEHKKNLQSDDWRLFQLEKTLSDPSNPYHQFGTGSLETLLNEPTRKGIDVRAELLKFYDRYYSANVMKLCILGRDSLDQLTKWTVEKFSEVRNTNIEPPRFENNPLTPNELGTLVFVKSVKDVRGLELTFPFSDQHRLFRVRPGRYLSHLIGHEGKGSILSLLKKKGWANFLSAGSNHSAGFEFFKIWVDLTENGLKHYEEVIEIVFQYIELLKKDGIQESIFREVQSLASTSFRFSEKSKPLYYTTHVAGLMQRPYPPEWILSGSSLIREWDPDCIRREGLNYLRPDAFRAFLISQKFDLPVELNKQERWYGTEYHVEKLSENLMKTISRTKENPDLELPGANDFIPKNFETHKVPIEMPAKEPTLIKNTRITRLWHKKDDTFWVPRANVWILFRNPFTHTTPGNYVKTSLFMDLLQDSLNEYAYDADVAGLSYSFENQTEGMLFLMEGYNDKMPVLLEKVVHRMKNFTVDMSRFTFIKDQLRRHYKNFALDQPYQHALFYLSYILHERSWTQEEKLLELEKITAEEVQNFIPFIFSHMHFESVMHGNIFREEALRMMEIVENIIDPRPLLPSQLIGPRSLLLPKQGGKFVYQRELTSVENLNSAVEFYCQVGDVTEVPLRARLSLLSQIAQEPCFNQLRTKEQLGYFVWSGVRKHPGILGFRIIVQSERDTQHLEERIEAFLAQLRSIIESLTEAEFKAQVNSLIAKKLEKDKNLQQETHRYWVIVHSGLYDFDQAEVDVNELKRIEKEDLLQFYDKHIHPSSPVRKKLSVHIRSHKAIRSPPAARRSPTPEHLESLRMCLSTRGVAIKQEDLERAIEASRDGELEQALRQLLIDETKAEEEEVEEMMRACAEALSLTPCKATKLNADGRLAPSPVPPGSHVVNGEALNGNVIVTDMHAFKAGMELSRAAVPLRPIPPPSLATL
ncbi:uncharacterized protein VTP21DRAFT_3536 [Calcarisporiella thermophila]|uniref:uncharacterized protein n=1 Tax=Calcarisporiella thermophila TaxID=911321 RepID=UPI00374278E5